MRSDGTSNRLEYLDGLRGVASIVILLSHCLSAWLPSVAFGMPDHRVPYLSPLAHTPLAIVWSGDTAVMVFFVLSGFVLARSASRQVGKEDELSTPRGALTANALKRVMRLGLPAGAAILLTGMVVQAGLMFNQRAAVISRSEWLAQFYLPGPRPGLLWSAFGGSIITGSDWWIGPLWSTHVQLFGSLLAFALVAVSGRDPRCVTVVAIVMGWSLIAGSSRFGIHFAAIAGGVLFHMLCERRRDRRYVEILPGRPRAKRALLCLLGALIIYVGSWPDEAQVGPWYSPVAHALGFTDNYLRPRAIAHTLAALLLTWLVLRVRGLQAVLATRTLCVVGRYSFAIYLVHWAVLMSVGAWVFAKLSVAVSSLYVGAAVASAATLVVTGVAAVLFRRWVEVPAQRIAERVAAIWVSPTVFLHGLRSSTASPDPWSLFR